MAGEASARIQSLVERAERDLEAYEPPADPPDEDRALEYLTEGVGPAIWVYIDGRTGEWERFDPLEFERLTWAVNTWLELYAGCYGETIESDVSLRTAAEALLDTHNIRDVAWILTNVPARSE